MLGLQGIDKSDKHITVMALARKQCFPSPVQKKKKKGKKEMPEAGNLCLPVTYGSDCFWRKQIIARD